MAKKKWVVDGSKQIAYLIEFIKKYIKCEDSESLVNPLETNFSDGIVNGKLYIVCLSDIQG